MKKVIKLLACSSLIALSIFGSTSCNSTPADNNNGGDDNNGGTQNATLKLSIDKSELKVGDSAKISVKDGETLVVDCKYESSATDVVSVDNDGTIHALKEGKSTIKATSGTKSGTLDVTVTAKAAEGTYETIKISRDTFTNLYDNTLGLATLSVYLQAEGITDTVEDATFAHTPGKVFGYVHDYGSDPNQAEFSKLNAFQVKKSTQGTVITQSTESIKAVDKIVLTQYSKEEPFFDDHSMNITLGGEEGTIDCTAGETGTQDYKKYTLTFTFTKKEGVIQVYGADILTFFTDITIFRSA